MESTGPRLIIVCGLPGSGKTTLAKKLEVERGAVRLSADDWMDALQLDLWDEASRSRIETLQWKIGQQLLSFGLTVIIEWGTWARAERDVLRAKARALGAAVELHHLAGSVDELFARLQRRGMENPPITHAALVRWAEIFEAPTAEELKLFDGPPGKL
jgi:predicted kinase